MKPYLSLTQTLFISLLGLTCFNQIIFAQTEYPNKPINFIVPYAAGGGADSRSRQIGQQLSQILKVPVIVENKAGAGGNIGTEFIAKAPPDGYTIGMGNFAPLAINKTFKIEYFVSKSIIYLYLF